MKGIWFDGVHSFEHLNLVLSEVDIPPAAVKTNYVDIPGGDGSVDLTEALGEVKYKDRECTFTFTAFPQDDFEDKKREVSNLLNGKRCELIVDKDPDYYWTGRCAINEYQSDKNIHKIVVGATVAPYKMRIKETVVTVPAGEAVVAVLSNSRKTVVPTIFNTDDATIIFGDTTYNLKAGTHTILDFELVAGDNQVTVTSIGSVKFTYREGDL